jgi:predicted MFS family arabinose efflux permease
MERKGQTFDAIGAFTITSGLVILVYALVKAEDFGWGSGSTIGLLALSVALIASFIAIEARSRSPLAPLSFFRNRTPTSANVIGLLVAASLFSMFYFISLYLQRVLGFDALEAGLAYLPLALTIVVSAGVASVVVERIGVKPALTFGLAAVAVGLLWFSQVDAGGSYVSDVLGPSIIAAVGLGFAFVSMTIAAVAGVSDDQAGLASGLINTSQQVGGALGLAVLATIANSTTNGLAGGPQNPEALTQGFQDAFLVGAGFAVVGVVLSLVLLRHRELREAQRQIAAREQSPVPAQA